MKYHSSAANIVSQLKTGEDKYFLTIQEHRIAAEAMPGQFLHVKTNMSTDPLLRRPLSIYGVDRKEGLLHIWYQVRGKGTRLLSALQPPDVIDLIGPLGKGFETAFSGKKAVLVGGGMGIAPLSFLGEVLSGENEVRGYFGARNKEQLAMPGKKLSFLYKAATEDGSSGFHGRITELLAADLAKDSVDIIFACGPAAMLLELKKIAGSAGIPLQVSLETTMACGVGACLGCTCRSTAQEDGNWLKVCQDGPVFWAQEVNWE